jgi:hypothetical protein
MTKGQMEATAGREGWPYFICAGKGIREGCAKRRWRQGTYINKDLAGTRQGGTRARGGKAEVRAAVLVLAMVVSKEGTL